MRAALKMIAFDLQVRRADTHYPTTIKRGHLLEKLTEQQEISTGLGANIEDVLEYLATRNGILVTDTRKHYRFPHLSVQEYLCACALAEFYDECPMPSALKTPEEGWSFPKNIVALLRHDTTRWREVTLFAGSILASEKTGQDKRWELIDELLPAELGNKELPYNMLASISVAAAVWAEDYIKARNHSHRRVREHLIACLKAIRNDQRLDIPDNAKNLEALSELEKQDEVKA
jgi:Trp operon repressor